MLRVFLLIFVMAGCAVLPASDPTIARSLEDVQTGLAAFATRFDLAPNEPIALDADTRARFDKMLQDLQLSIWRAQTRSETATDATKRSSELALSSLQNCREAVLTLYRITEQFSLSRDSFEESQTVQICLTAANIEQALR